MTHRISAHLLTDAFLQGPKGRRPDNRIDLFDRVDDFAPRYILVPGGPHDEFAAQDGSHLGDRKIHVEGFENGDIADNVADHPNHFRHRGRTIGPSKRHLDAMAERIAAIRENARERFADDDRWMAVLPVVE